MTGGYSMEQPTSDEKVLAALAHGSVILFFLGPIGAIVIWSIQRTKSKYVRYHALQAMGYQAFAFWIWFVSIFIVTFALMGISILFFAIMGDGPSSSPQVMFFIQPLMMLIIFGMWGLMFLLGFVGAVFCMMGKEFRYPIIGNWLQRKIFDDQVSEEEAEKWEDYWVGGVCHATAILQLWGMITPLVVWFSQKERSARLRFQSLQAAIYQFIAMAAYMLIMGVYFFLYIFMIAGLAISGIPADPQQTASPVFMAFFIFFLALIMLLWLAAFLLYPIYLILALVASIRTVRGHDFKYPILSGIIMKRLDSPVKSSQLNHE